MAFEWKSKSKLFKMGYIYGKLEERSENVSRGYEIETFIDDVNNLFQQLQIKITNKDVENIMGLYTSSEIEDIGIVKGRKCKNIIDLDVCVCMRKGRIEIVNV